MYTTTHRNAPLFSDVFNALFNNNWNEPTTSWKGTKPAMNIMEAEDGYKLEMAVPGLQKSDFDIKLNNDGELVIAAEKKALPADCNNAATDTAANNAAEADNKAEDANAAPSVKYWRHEFSPVKFSQTFTLPDDVELAEIKANVADGLLTIDMPKKKPVPPVDNTRAIEVM